jgi:hypothetical protein
MTFENIDIWRGLASMIWCIRLYNLRFTEPVFGRFAYDEVVSEER